MGVGFICRPFWRVLSSAVEHLLHTQGVAGSNPAARTIFWYTHLFHTTATVC